MSGDKDVGGAERPARKAEIAEVMKARGWERPPAPTRSESAISKLAKDKGLRLYKGNAFGCGAVSSSQITGPPIAKMAVRPSTIDAGC